MRLLVVDDDQEIPIAIKSLFRNLVDQIHVAMNGEDAYEIIRSEPIDLLVCDIVMPKMGGFELLAKIQAEGISIPSIVMTGYPSRTNVEKAQEYGCISFLDKPTGLLTLKDEVEKIRALNTKKPA